MYIFQAVKRLNKPLVFENRRNHLQVLSDILELCRTPQAKTCILRNTNTSFKLLETYLLQLQTSGLIELQAKIRRYATTSEGQRFVDTWAYLKAMLYPEELPRTKGKNFTLYSNNLSSIPLKTPIK